MAPKWKSAADARSARDEYRSEADSHEVSTFKKGLESISLDTIRERLVSRTISRKWKRDLVEAEFERRVAQEVDERGDVAPEVSRRRASRGWGKWLAALIIGGCISIVVYTIYQISVG